MVDQRTGKVILVFGLYELIDILANWSNMSIHYEDARKMAINYVDSHQLPEDQQLDGNKIILIEEKTIEKDYGWYFFRGASKWIETGEFRYAIAGGAPFLVRKDTGELITFMSSYSIEEIIETFEKQLKNEKNEL